jgi:cyclin H
MELLNMVDDNIQGMKALKEPAGGGSAWRVPADGRAVEKKHIVDRVNQAYHVARNTLDAPASTTDVYFLYTPSQILLAALQLADEPLLHFYLDSKLPTDAQLRPRILATIRECADMMGAFRPEDIIPKDARVALEAKLEVCRDPSTRDMIKSHAAMKRNGAADDGDSESEAKKRKMEKHKSAREADDMFGPAIGKG